MQAELNEQIYYELADPNGVPYYFNPVTQKTQWEVPIDGRILPYSYYQKQTEDKQIQKTFGRNSNFVQILIKGLPSGWTNEDFL